MKTYFIKLLSLIITIFLVFVFAIPINAQEGITFSFANGQVTTSGSDTFFEFDVMAVATANTQFKLAQVYINYNTAGFGSSISGTTNLEVTPGSLLNIVNHSGSGGDIGSYIITTNNNTSSNLAIQNSWQKTDLGGGETGFALTNTLGSSAQVYVHVKIKVQNTSETSGLSFDNTVSQFDLQQFYFTSGDITANYNPVNVGVGLDGALPVELSSFTASIIKSNINLKWQTKTEVDNYGFEVERKVSKKDLESGSWVKMGFVPGHGNSNSPKNYTFTDKNPVGGSKFVYRLKQIDSDGKFEYSDEVEIEMVPDKFELFQNYPNPFNPVTNIKFALPKTTKVAINVYNLLGEKVATLLNEDKEAGFYNIQFDASNFSSGVYIFRLATEDFIQTKKMTLIK